MAIKRRRRIAGALALLVIVLLVGVHLRQDVLPPGLAHEGAWYPAEDVRLLRDVSYVNQAGDRVREHEIFADVFRVIARAEKRILLDMFLFNAFGAETLQERDALSQRLTDALIARKQAVPELQIIMISDPVNTVYGGLVSPHFEALRAAGIEVVVTRLDALRDSNPAYSAFWRLLISPFGNAQAATLPSPFNDARVSVRSWLRLLNFKANHRKLLVADGPDGRWVAIVSSANPHDGSAAHSNVAVRFTGPAARDVLRAEAAVLRLSGVDAPTVHQDSAGPVSSETPRIQVLSEGAIKAAILENLGSSGEGDDVRLWMFYLSDRDVIAALVAARERGASVRVVLDPNKDAFGREKNGIPNRPVGAELNRHGVAVRWCQTRGEQCHAKMLLVRYADGESRLLSGSANFTRRNLDNYNLEANVHVAGPPDTPALQQADALFERVWHNQQNQGLSLDFEAFRDESVVKYWTYRVMEATGISTF